MISETCLILMWDQTSSAVIAFSPLW